MNIVEVFKKEVGTRFLFKDEIWVLSKDEILALNNEVNNTKILRAEVSHKPIDNVCTLECICNGDFKEYKLYTLEELIEMQKNTPYDILISLEEIDVKNCETAYTIKEALMQLSAEYNAIDFYNIINNKSFIKL